MKILITGSSGCSKIDYDIVHKNITDERAKSIQFLKSELELL